MNRISAAPSTDRNVWVRPRVRKTWCRGRRSTCRRHTRLGWSRRPRRSSRPRARADAAVAPARSRRCGTAPDCPVERWEHLTLSIPAGHIVVGPEGVALCGPGPRRGTAAARVRHQNDPGLAQQTAVQCSEHGACAVANPELHEHARHERSSPFLLRDAASWRSPGSRGRQPSTRAPRVDCPRVGSKVVPGDRPSPASCRLGRPCIKSWS